MARAQSSLVSLPRLPQPWFAITWILATVIVAALPYLGLNSFWMRQASLVMLLALLTSGINLSFGWAGELNLGVPAMYAAGAYAAGWLTINVVNDTLLAIVFGAITAIAVGVIAGVPGLRLGGWMLAISSFYLVLLIPSILQIVPKPILGGNDGLTGIPLPQILGIRLSFDAYFALTAVVVSVWFLLYRNLVRSRLGNALLILQHGDALAPSLGLSRYRLKLAAYAFASIPAGVAGALFAQLDGYVGAESFTFALAIAVLAAGVIAGLRSIYAIFVGVIFVQFVRMAASDLSHLGEVGFGVFLVVGGLLLGGGTSALALRFYQRFSSARTPATSESTSRSGEAGAAVQSPRADQPGQDQSGPRQEADAAVAFKDLPGRRLTVDRVVKQFGGVVALNEISFTAEPGQITALIGPNGSGKTTMLNVINGFYRATSGSITLGDTVISDLSDQAVARQGVSRTFQTPAIPGNMSVRDLAASSRIATHRSSFVSAMLRLPGYRRVAAEDDAVAGEMLAAVGLLDRAEDPAASLALGTRRMAELTRALANQPSLILLDEIASGLDHSEVAELVRVLQRARDAGATIVLVEHNFTLVRSLADQVVVLADGELLVSGTPAEVEAHPQFLDRFLGAGAAISGTTVRSTPSQEALS